VVFVIGVTVTEESTTVTAAGIALKDAH